MTGKRVDPLAQTEMSEPGHGAAARTPQPVPEPGPGATVLSMAPGTVTVSLPATGAAAGSADPATRPWMLALAVLAGAATAFGLAWALH